MLKGYNLNTSDFASIAEYQDGYQAPAIYPEDRNVGEGQTKEFTISATKFQTPSVGDITTTPVDGYVKVEYKAKEADKAKVDLKGTSIYYVNPNANISLARLNAPEIKVKDKTSELKEEAWVDAEDKALDRTKTITKDDLANGLTYYVNLQPKSIIEIEDPENPGTKPTENHTMVAFDAADGTFADGSSKKAYRVENTKTLGDVVDMLNEVPVKQATNFLEWQEAGVAIKLTEAVGSTDRTFVANYTELEKQIEVTITQPKVGKGSIQVLTSPVKADVTLYLNEEKISTSRTNNLGTVNFELPRDLKEDDVIKVTATKEGYRQGFSESGVN